MRRIDSIDVANRELQKFVPPALSDRKYTLKTMRELMDCLGNPQDKIKVVHVAGTSGKTSTCYYIAAMLHASGKKVGLTVSPHIDEINERVQIGMKPLGEREFCLKLEVFLDIVDKSTLKPSYFEVLVAFAYWVFANEKVDYAVVEVGLGGLLDGTNVVSRPDKTCVITDIGLDHTHVLGHTIREISAQKAGIILDRNSVFMNSQSSEVEQVVQTVCNEKKAALNKIVEDSVYVSLPLFQRRNWSLAFAVVQHLLGSVSQKAIDESVRTVVPARMEIINLADKTIIVDGSHNEQKLQALANSVKEMFPNQPIAALVSFGHNKESTLQGSLKVIAGLVSHVIFTKFQMGQDEYRTALEPKQMQELCRRLGFSSSEIEEIPEQAFRKLTKRQEPILLVTGSFFLLNHIRPLLK